MALDPIQIREAFHLLVLRTVAPELGLALRLKGGVNLRLFYGSERYSEDMDLDADPRLRERLKRLLAQTLRAPRLRRELLGLGIRDVEIGDRPAKDTDTVLRYKMGLIAGGVRYPTKIEVSYRGEAPAEWASLAAPLPEVTDAYVARDTMFPAFGHYGRNAALWQKIAALALRTEVQARDVFDLALLLESRLDTRYGAVDAGFLCTNLTDSVLQEAARRALEISREEFRDQVAAFLAPDARLRHTSAWEAAQVTVASFIENVERTPRLPGQVAEPPRRGARLPGRRR